MTVFIPGKRNFFEDVKYLKSDRLDEQVERQKHNNPRCRHPIITRSWSTENVITRVLRDSSSSESSESDDGDCSSLATTVSVPPTPFQELSEVSEKQQRDPPFTTTLVHEQRLHTFRNEQSRLYARTTDSVWRISEEETVLGEMNHEKQQSSSECATPTTPIPIEKVGDSQGCISGSYDSASTDSSLNIFTNKSPNLTNIQSLRLELEGRNANITSTNTKTTSTMNLQSWSDSSSVYSDDMDDEQRSRRERRGEHVHDLMTHWRGEEWLRDLPHPSEYAQFSINPFWDEILEETTSQARMVPESGSRLHTFNKPETPSSNHTFSTRSSARSSTTSYSPPSYHGYTSSSHTFKSRGNVTVSTNLVDPVAERAKRESVTSSRSFGSGSGLGGEGEARKRRCVGGKLKNWFKGKRQSKEV